MRKWRPAYKCIYCIPEIHGNYKSLEIIINRIIPLRFSIGQEDILFFLGNFIDKGENSYEVVEKLISLKKEYNDSIFLIKGASEELLLRSIQSEATYKYWLSQGGFTTINSYLKFNNLNSDPLTFPHSRLTDIVPVEHLSFLRELPTHLQTEDYIFLHAGFNYLKPFEETTTDDFLFDNSVAKYIKKSLKENISPKLSVDDKVFIASHNPVSKLPFIYSKYFMLSAGAPNNLIVFELNDMKCGMVKDGKSRIYEHKFKYFE